MNDDVDFSITIKNNLPSGPRTMEFKDKDGNWKFFVLRDNEWVDKTLEV